VKILLVDGNNAAHRCFTDQALCARHPDDQVLPIAFLRIVSSICRDYLPNRVMCAWDRGRSPIRMAVLPSYKGDREEKRKSPSSKHDVIERVNPWMAEVYAKIGIIDISMEGVEADDMIFHAHQYCRAKGWDVLVSSNDSDLRQLLDEGTEIHIGKNKPLLSLQSFMEEHGFHPKWYPIYKAITGDRADCIPGVRGMGPVTARMLLLMLEREKPSDLVSALGVLRSIAQSNRRARKLLEKEGWAQFKQALQLVDLTLEPAPATDRFATIEEEILNPTLDQAGAQEAMRSRGLSELSFDVPMYTCDLVRLRHGT
jgi:5'-3' exonuclease